MSAAGFVPMVDPAGEYRTLAPEIDAAVRRVLASGRYILGPEGAALETELANYVGANHAVAVASGTDALHLALRAADVGPGDEVVVPAFTFIASAEAVSYTGARPVFADIDPATFNLSPRSLEACLSTRTRAVIAVHLFGQCAALDEIAAICRDRALVLVEDCAQALGADYEGRRAGAWGEFGCFSFYPTKNLAACGDAGLVTVREARHAEALRVLRHHGSRRTYEHDVVGYNSRLDEIQAAVLRVKLRYLEGFNAHRRRVAQAYHARLAGATPTLPYEHGRGTHVYHQFTLRTTERDTLRATLEKAQIASGIYYPIPLHRQPVYATEHAASSLPASESASREVLSLPIHPLLGDAEVDRVVAAVRTAI